MLIPISIPKDARTYLSQPCCLKLRGNSPLRLDKSVTPTEIGFVSASVVLRPPRVAILVADDERWRDWAITALAIASGYWGGVGFVLVPYDTTTGTASANFADIIRAYDPDHVVSLALPLATWDEWYPGSVPISGVKDEVERKQLIANAHQEITGSASDTARDEVASWCAPMRVSRLKRDVGARQRETVKTLRRRTADTDRFRQGFAPAPSPGLEARLAAAETWRSDLGLLAAMRVGVADIETEKRPEPPVKGLDWFIRAASDAPTSLIWNHDTIPSQHTAGLEPWFTAGQHLIQVNNSYLEDQGAIVIGDSGTDFALAVAYDRMIGNGIWLTPAMLADEEVFKHEIQPALWSMLSDFENEARHLVVDSITESETYLKDVAVQLRAPRYQFAEDGPPEALSEHETVRVGRAVVTGGYMEWIVNDHVGVPVSIPVTKMPDGSTEALSGLETPVPADLVHPDHSGWVPYWYVDVALGRDQTPRARDFPAHALLVGEGALPSVNLRASKESVTFDPHSLGFVSAGSFLPGRIGRPRVRGLSMMAWVAAMAEPEGLGVRLSSAGRQAELIRRRLGSRDALLDLATPANVRMLRGFVPLKKRPTPEERDPETVVLGLDPYLSFNAMETLLRGTPGETGEAVDRLISARLLRRGLALDCVECGRPSFIDADRVGQQFECPQCAALNDLVSERWKGKTNEPKWFYDLYTVFRELLAANGDVVLLAADALRNKSGTYVDAPELEFYDLSSGKAVAEVDVIASVDREVVLVEAKSNGTFTTAKRGPQTQKLLRVAKALRADRIVLATTKSSWNAQDVNHLTKEAAKVKPFAVSVEVSNL